MALSFSKVCKMAGQKKAKNKSKKTMFDAGLNAECPSDDFKDNSKELLMDAEANRRLEMLRESCKKIDDDISKKLEETLSKIKSDEKLETLEESCKGKEINDSVDKKLEELFEPREKDWLDKLNFKRSESNLVYAEFVKQKQKSDELAHSEFVKQKTNKSQNFLDLKTFKSSTKKNSNRFGIITGTIRKFSKINIFDNRNEDNSSQWLP